MDELFKWRIGWTGDTLPVSKGLVSKALWIWKRKKLKEFCKNTKVIFDKGCGLGYKSLG